jgi:hypothetical protein
MATSKHSVLFKDLVPCVAGQNVFTQREKANKLISEAKKVVLVLDKAFFFSLEKLLEEVA